MAKRNKKKNKKKTKLTPEEVIRRKAESEKRQNATNPFSKVRGDKNHEKRKALIKEDIVHTLPYKSKAGAFNDKRISTINAAMSQDEIEQRFLANRRGKALIDELNERVDTARNTPREALWIKPPIKMIKMHEPVFDDWTDPKNPKNKSYLKSKNPRKFSGPVSREEKTAKQKKKQAQNDKKAYKKEIRELKRHREAMAEVKDEMIREDRAKNKRKFKEMLGDIANQAGEFKQIKKRKYLPHF